MTWTAGALVPVILIGFGVAAVVIFALTGFRKWWQVLDAEREAALAPVRLLREQDQVLCEVMAKLNVWLDSDLKDKLINTHEQYAEVATRAGKGKRWSGRIPPAPAGG